MLCTLCVLMMTILVIMAAKAGYLHTYVFTILPKVGCGAYGILSVRVD